MSAEALELAMKMDHRKLARRVVELSERILELSQAVKEKDELVDKLSTELVSRNRDMARMQGTRISAARW